MESRPKWGEVTPAEGWLALTAVTITWDQLLIDGQWIGGGGSVEVALD